MEKKISLPETLILVIVVGSYEIFEIVADLLFPVPFLGQALLIINFFGDWFIWLLVQFWIIIRGLKNSYYIVGNALEMIPGVDMLPLRTIGLIATIYVANHPEISKNIPSATKPKEVGKIISLEERRRAKKAAESAALETGQVKAA